jgi:conserved hypothetical protein
MIDFKYFLIEQPIGKLYLGALTAKDINEIAESNTRTAYNQKGIQRKIIDSRVKEIAKYSARDDAIFPTPIVLSASSKYINFESDGLLRIDNDNIKNNEAFFSIIDGQHRIAGIKEADKLDVFTLPVVLVLDTFLEQDAEIFVTINGNQRSVSKSLLYDLFGLSKNRSVEKVCHTIIKALNKDDNSKIKQKIKMLGYRDEESKSATVSQATMIDSLIKLITNNPNLDNRYLLNGEKLKDLDENRFIFRKYFEQEQDDIIYKILKNYFNAWTTAKEKLNSNKDLVFLEKSIGYMASFYLLRAVFLKSKLEKSATEDYFQNNLSKILNKFNADYNSKTYSSSQSGARELFKDLVRSAIESNTFDEKYIKAYRDDSDLKKWFDEYEDILFIEK